MKINVTVLILAALMAAIIGCDETLQLEWTDTIGTRGAVWSGIQNRGTLTLINPGAGAIPQETVSAGDAMSFILTSKLELDTTTSKLILTTKGKQYDASLTLIEAPFVLPGVRNYRASFTPENDSPSGVYHISAALWDSAGARRHLTLGKINLTVEGDTTPPVITNIVVTADSAPVRVGGVVTLSFIANEPLDIANTQAIFTIAGGQHEQSVTLVPNTEYQYRTTLNVTDAVPDGTLEEVVVIAHDAAGNSGQFTSSADLTIEKVAPPPPDTTPPAITNIVVSADSSPIRVGGVVTLSFISNEPLDTENTQAIFTIAGGQHEQAVTLVPNTEYQYQTTLSVTDAVPDGTLEEVVVIAQDPAGNSGRFTAAADLTIEKVAPPPPDTTPPVVSNIAVSADSAPIRVGGVVTLSFISNEPLDTENTQAIFTIAGEQYEQSVTLIPNTEYQYQTTLAVTDAIPDGTLEEVVVIAQDAAGNSGRFTGAANLTIEKVAPPPTIIALSAVSDNADSVQAVAGNTVTLSFTTNKPIVPQQSRLTFTTADGTYDRVIRITAGATNQYFSQLSITDATAVGALRASITLTDTDGKTSGAIVRDTTVTITKPPLEPLVHPDPEFWDISSVRAGARLESLSEAMTFGLEGRTDEQIIARYEDGLLGVDLLEPGLDFILYDLYSICLQERPDKAAEAVQEGGIIIHPLAKNGLVFDWMHLAYGYPDASKEERLLLFRRLIRFWGVDPVFGERSVNGLPMGTLLPEDYVYVQPPANPFLTATERQVRKYLEQISQEVRQLLIEHPGFPVIELYNTALGTDYGIFVDFIFTDLWNIYKEEQPAQAAGIAADDIPLHPITGNGLLVAWLVLQYDNPEKSKDERLVLFRQLARGGKVQPILEE